MLTDDMDELLRQYYAWSNINNPADIYYPHRDPVRRLRGSSIPSLSISDDEARHIDRALCCLKAEIPAAHVIIVSMYRDRRTLRWLETQGFGDRKTLARIASDGRQFVMGFLARPEPY